MLPNSLMLNGRGNTYEQKKVDIVLTEQEAEAVGTVVDMELCGHHPPEAEAILNSALEKIDRIAFAKVQTITCHGLRRFPKICCTPSCTKPANGLEPWMN